MKRTVIKVAGESGMGLLSVGNIVSKALKGMGFYVVSDREYPSLIKGGHSNLQIDFSAEPLHSLSKSVDFVIALDRPGLVEYMNIVKPGGVLIHGFERHQSIPNLETRAKERGIHMIYLPARTLAYSLGGTELMANMVLLGLLWRLLGFDLKPLETGIEKQFANKPKLLTIDLQCVRVGFSAQEGNGGFVGACHGAPTQTPDTILVNGNQAITLGAIQAGVRAYYAYPMSPASSILTYMAEYARETGLLVKQAEDEITAAQMAVGSMFMGTRALVATSGGGYDLMTETVSLAGMIETPLVIVIAQRPGPATGLPTWSAQADLNLAIHSGHGEFARVVIGVSDPASCYELIQHAMNYADEFQTAVIVLTEKTICEMQTTVPPFEEGKIPIKRGLLVTDPKELETLKASDRFKITENGLSKRWIPGSGKTWFYGNGDEHKEDGVLTEEGAEVSAMIAKRMKKMETIEKALPEPTIHGVKKGAAISFVGWGSSKNAVLDAIQNCKEKGITVNYLHFDYLWPFKTATLTQFFRDNQNVHLIEGNYQGQLGNLIEALPNLRFKGRLLQWNGRPFCMEDVTDYISRHS
ncbi:2-oxoacid:acceptor oxidoreductase subunit alpha [Candidatus Peregrinibacteria bacterium]|nr:2-oxoacid:acceptor oxidoreductase subunit alpha [Candidatus Peregrinibacteria bacterium]